MATRAKALRQFAKKYFNLDLVGMSETAVLKDLLKKEYNIDAVGNSVVSVLMNAAGNDGGGCEHPGAYLKVKDGVDFCWVTDIETGDVTVNLKLNGEIVEAPYSAEALASLFELTQDCEPVVIAEGGVYDVVTGEDVTVSLYAQNEDGSVVGETEVVFPADEAHHCE